MGQGSEPPKLLKDPVTIPTAGRPSWSRGRGADPGGILRFSVSLLFAAVGKLNAVLEGVPGEDQAHLQAIPARHALAGCVGRCRRHAAHRQGNSGPCMMASLLTGANCPSHDPGRGPHRRTRYAALRGGPGFRGDQKDRRATDMEDGDARAWKAPPRYSSMAGNTTAPGLPAIRPVIERN